MNKIIVIIICSALVLVGGFYFYHQAVIQSSYVGLPTVPCQDFTQPIIKNFSFHLQIQISGQNYPLDPAIGHDYGDCLHEISTNDASGVVHIKSNASHDFTLGQFFDVWKKTFNKNQIFQYQVTKGHSLKVLVNSHLVTTYENTLLKPNQKIEIIYN